MCDFKAGDEVVCLDARRVDWLEIPLVEGNVYVVSNIRAVSDGIGIDVVGINIWPHVLAPERFRKVQRRDMSAWLSTAAKNTDHIDKRAPAHV